MVYSFFKKLFHFVLEKTFFGKMYRFIRKVANYFFVKIFPNAEILLELKNLREKNELQKKEINELNISKQSLIIEKISLENINKNLEEKNLVVSNEKSSLSKELNHFELSNKYLLNKLYKILKKRKLKVGILVFFYEHWDSLSSVYKELLRNKNFEPIVLVGPRNHFVDKWRFLDEAKKFFDERKIKYIPLYDSESKSWLDIKTLDVDLLILNTPWESCFPEQYHIKNLSSFVRCCYIPYGIMSAKLEDTQFNMPFHNLCWRIFVETALHKELYKEYSAVPQDNVILTGYPKLDVYLDKKTKKSISKLWQVKETSNSRVKRIIWAPHWTVGKTSEILYSSFMELKDYFFNLALNKPNIEIMIKPHPGLWDNLKVQGLMSEKEISNLKKKFSTLNNIWFYEKPDYFDYFKSSDALILDSISFISEYYPTKKPIFFITKSNMHKFNKYGDLIMDGVYKGWEPVEIDDFINNVVEAGKDPMYNRRITILKNNIYIPQEGAGLKIVNYLKKELYNGENSK